MKTKLKALEPLIASILLIVVAVILVTIVLTWGKNFTTQSVSQTTGLINHDVLSDKQSFMKFVEARNGMYTFDYYPPNTGNVNFKVVGYSLLGYNDYIPLEPEKEIIRAGKFMLPLGIVNEEAITISLLLEDGSYLTFKNIKNINLSPSQSDCPEGFVPVPGNHLYGTVGSKGGFCVAKYEMKMDANEDELGDLVADYPDCKYSTDYNVWYYLNSGCSTGTIVSTPQGSPITGISQQQAITACQAIGGHLITNEEWMTLARNIEIVPSNWSSGVVGQGSLKRGNAGNEVANVSYNGVDPESGTGRNQLAMLKLTNGSEVWDMSGNVLEWNDKIYNNIDYNVPILDIEDYLYFYPDYSVLYNPGYEVNYEETQYFVKYGDIGLNYKDLFLLNSDYNKDNGIGYMEYEYDGDYNISFLRGGYWNDATNAGVLDLYALSDPSSTTHDIGFRCVVVPE